MRLLIIITMMVFVSFNSNACDNCGGGGLGLDANILSSNNGNSIGLLFGSRHYKTFSEGEKQNNYLLNWTINGNYQAHKLVQLKFYVPMYLQGNRSADTKQFGLGDVLAMASFKALDKTSKNEIKQHRLFFSAGIELPTGLYQNDLENSSLNIPFGSKSWDFLLGTSYAFRFKNYITSTNVMAKITTENSSNFKYGNSVEAIWQHTYKIRLKTAQLFPYLGLKFNWQKEDRSNNYLRTFTGGNLLSEVMGLQFNYNQYKLVFNMEIPISRHLNNKDLVVGNIYGFQFTYQF